MTTIAVNHEMVCSDSLCVDSGVRSVVQKIYTVPGGIIGFAGDVSQGLMFIEWYLSKGTEEYPFNEHFEAVVLNEEGEIYSYDSGLMPIKMEQPFYAIGSGKQAATAAMLLGCDPIEAVDLAIQVDTCTDGAVQILRLSDIPKEVKPKKSKKRKKK